MNMNREVTYNWKSQVLLLIGALLINVMLVSGVKADGPSKEKDIEKQPYRMVDLGDAKFLSTEDILAIDWSKGDYTYFTVVLLAKYQAKDKVEKGSKEWERLKLSIETQEQFLTDFVAKKLEEAKVAGPKTSNEYASRNGDLEKSIRNLKRRYEEAYRKTLDNPTKENILAEVYTEEELKQVARELNEYQFSRGG